MTTTIYTNATMFDGVSRELVTGQHVVVEAGRIRDVASDRESTPEGATIVDLGGRFLMPGLIDAHVHALAANVDIGKLRVMPRSLLYQHARLYLEAMLARGFTTVRDACGADYGLAMAIEQGLIQGPRLFFCGPGLTQTGGHGDFRGLEESGHPMGCACCMRGTGMEAIADGVDAVRRVARENLRTGATQLKIMASGGIASPRDPIWNLQYSEEEIRAVVWEAKSWRAYVMAHAYTPEAISRCVRFGVRSIEHGNLIDDETAALCHEHDAYVVPTLATYEMLGVYGREAGFPDESLRKLEDVREAGMAALDTLQKHNVNMGFGTDLLGSLQVHQSREFAIRARNLEMFDVLISATSTNARLLQHEGELGEITPGAFADLLVLDKNPIEDAQAFEPENDAIHLIVKNGNPIAA